MTSKRIALGMICATFAAAPTGVSAQVELPGPVEQVQLAKDAFSTGTLTRGDGAMAPVLWRGADPARINELLTFVPSRLAAPSLGEALRRALLSPGDAPSGASDSLGGRKLLALARAGFTEEARTVASLSNAPTGDPWVGQALAVADLLDGTTNAACRRNAALTSGRDAEFWVKLRVLCYAAAGERDAADLTLTLLREQGALGNTDEVLLTALATGVSPKQPVKPASALDLAAILQLELPLAPALLDEADAGVLKAVARNGALEPATRINAANRAATMGVVSTGDLIAFYESFDLEVADVARAADIALERSGDPVTDVLMFQSVKQMTAPEFLRDKAARINQALGLADSFPRSYALALLYADEIDAMEGALLSAAEAGRFSLARMAVGDGDGAARWLFSMLGSGGLTALDEEDAMEMIDLTNLLAVLDPISAAAVAEAAGISIAATSRRGAITAAAHTDDQLRGQITEAAFDAAIDGVPGQAALAALAMSDVAAPGDNVANVIISQSLRAAGLNDLRHRLDFEAAWRGMFVKKALLPAPAPTDAALATEAAVQTASVEVIDGPAAPRLKPRSSE